MYPLSVLFEVAQVPVAELRDRRAGSVKVLQGRATSTADGELAAAAGKDHEDESDVEDRHVVAQILADRRWPWAPG